MIATYTALELARGLKITPQAMRNHLAKLTPGSKVVRGKVAQAWTLDQLPTPLLHRLAILAQKAGCRGPHHYLASIGENPAEKFVDSRLASFSAEQLEKATALRDSLAPLLGLHEALSQRELARRAHVRLLADPRIADLVSLSTVRRIVQRVIKRGEAFGDWEVLDLYAAEIETPAPESAHKFPKLSALAALRTGSDPLGKLREAEVFEAAHADLQSLVPRHGSKKAKGLVLDFLFSQGLLAVSSRESLRKKLDRVFRLLQEGASVDEALSDRRTSNPGRKRAFDWDSPEQKQRFQSLYLRTNRTHDSGSTTLAARLYAEENEGLAAVLAQRKSKHDLPAAVIEAAQEAKGLVAFHREGERGLRKSAYTPGRLRRSPDGTRRLYAGEQQSWDDGTINFGVTVPWPWGGDPCSDKFKVKLGRFQLLLCHDDASSYVPSWTYVVRPAQSYRGPETAGAILRTARDIGVPDRVVIEGGVWQGKRVLELLKSMDVNWVDAKGRPQCKLVENYFNRLWTRLSVENGQVGRFRAEMKGASELYQACQSGRKDPRHHFPSLEEAVSAIERAVAWLNTEPIESKVYGSWIPQVRWQEDLAATPRPRLSGDWLWMAAPVCEERVVSRGMVACTAEAPLGLKAKWHFAHPSLWQYEKKRVRIYFDPLGEAPVKGTVVLAEDWAGDRAGAVICEAESLDPLVDGAPDHARQINRALRATMRREYRSIQPDDKTGQQRVRRSESEVRGLNESTQIERGEASGHQTAHPHRRESGMRLIQQAQGERNVSQPEPDLDEIERLEAEAFARGDIFSL